MKGKEISTLKEFRKILENKLKKTLPTFYSVLKNEKLLKLEASVSNQDFLRITDLHCTGSINFELEVEFQGHLGINQEFKYQEIIKIEPNLKIRGIYENL